ncbi:hypothetical protein JCM30566_12620 [Marinitoga arctica]
MIIKNKKIEYLSIYHKILPIIFFSFVYLSYNIFINGFISMEIQDFFNIPDKFLMLLNIPVFLGIILGIFISNLFFNKKYFIVFILISILINILIFFLKNFFLFLLIRFITSIGLGVLTGNILAYYLIYENNISSTKAGIPFGILAAAILTSFFVHKSGWEIAILFLLTGIFILIGISFLFSYIFTNKIHSTKFLKINKKYLLIFSTLFFIIGMNFYFLIMNIKYILIIKHFDYILINLYLIIFPIFIISGYFISEYLYKNFNNKNSILYIISFVIFISISNFYIPSDFIMTLLISLNLLAFTMIWNITFIYSLNFFDRKFYFFLTKLMFIITSIGGIVSSILSHLFYENLYEKILLTITFTSIIFALTLLILSKYNNRNNHFIK